MFEDDSATAVIVTPAPDAPDEFYCEHGKYVGGMGADILCHYCEGGYSWTEYQYVLASKRDEHSDRENLRVLQDWANEVFEYIGAIAGPEQNRWKVLLQLYREYPELGAQFSRMSDARNAIVERIDPHGRLRRN